MKEKVLILVAGLFAANLSLLSAQEPVATESEYDKAYERRIQQEYLYGVYIPKDLSDAIVQLNKLTERESLQKFRLADEEEAVRKLHFSLGRWIIHNWGFYGGSRLSLALKGMGLHHPDDMARLIIRSLHRSLNKKPIEVKAQIEAFQSVREAERQKRLESAEVIYLKKQGVNADSVEAGKQRK
ncbi:MAG: DUF6794 domain-containing protein [Phaeodactylibacter sp.]|uniref:DUF6794 domain-containing protein n=1 Tax=Phaeodactylibacter sp. TaxID=1940289 RepID=UPI0032EEB05F